MKKIFLLLIVTTILVSGCTTSEISSQSIYEQNKDSVLYVDMYCTVYLSYPAFDIGFDYDDINFYDYLEIELVELGNIEIISYTSGAEGSGFVANNKVITNSHLISCVEEEELFFMQSYLSYLIEIHASYLLEPIDIEYYVDFDIEGKADFILDKIEKENQQTEWTKEDIVDYIVYVITLHLYNNAEVSSIIQDDILLYYTNGGFDNGLTLSLIEEGEHFPGEDYAILNINENNIFNNMNLGDSDNIVVGEKIYVIGYPESATLDYEIFPEPTITQGIISSLKTSEMDVTYIQIDAATSGGSSGSPVFNENGEVIGILTAGEGERFNFVLPSSYFINKV